MATYILLATYTEQGIKGIKDTVKRTDAVKELAKKAGAHHEGELLDARRLRRGCRVRGTRRRDHDRLLTVGRQARQRQDADAARASRARRWPASWARWCELVPGPSGSGTKAEPRNCPVAVSPASRSRKRPCATARSWPNRGGLQAPAVERLGRERGNVHAVEAAHVERRSSRGRRALCRARTIPPRRWNRTGDGSRAG